MKLYYIANKSKWNAEDEEHWLNEYYGQYDPFITFMSIIQETRYYYLHQH